MLIKHKNKSWHINTRLAELQDVPFDDFCKIVELHKERSDLVDFLERTTDVSLMKIIAGQLTNIEFELQLLWNFQPDANYHKSYKLPHCTCPKWENEMAYPYLIYKNENCLLHGI